MHRAPFPERYVTQVGMGLCSGFLYVAKLVRLQFTKKWRFLTGDADALLVNFRVVATSYPGGLDFDFCFPKQSLYLGKD